MKPPLASLLAVVLAGLPGCAPRTAHVPASEGADVSVKASGFRVRPSARHAVDGEVVGTLQADAADTLLSVSVPIAVAALAEIRDVTADSVGATVERVRPILDLPEDRPVVLEPGGTSIRLVSLSRPLRPPHTVTLRLRFARAGERVLEVPVRED